MIHGQMMALKEKMGKAENNGIEPRNEVPGEAPKDNIRQQVMTLVEDELEAYESGQTSLEDMISALVDGLQMGIDKQSPTEAPKQELKI